MIDTAIDILKNWIFKKAPPIVNPNHTNKAACHIVDALHTTYKHVICIDPSKSSRFWSDVSELNQWCNEYDCFWLADRAVKDYNGKWLYNSIGGGDYFFIATNSDDSAMLARIVWL